MIKNILVAFSIMMMQHPLLWSMASRPSTDPNAPPPPAWISFMPIIIMVVIFYVLIFRPQARQRKQRQSMLSALKRDDKIVTQGGLIATIVNIGPSVVEIKLSEGTKVKILRSAITDIYNESSTPIEQQKEPVATIGK